jgi:folylpolyglutamate synthase/dihydropteroate synthase
MKSEIINNHKDAYKALIASKNNTKIITGSFYLLGQIRSLNKQKN